MNTNQLFDQAYDLERTLQRLHYERNVIFARSLSYDRRAETDPQLRRLERVIGTAQRRMVRRWVDTRPAHDGLTWAERQHGIDGL